MNDSSMAGRPCPLASPRQLTPRGRRSQNSETEILLAYGGVRFASKVGQLAGNHFLTISKGNEYLVGKAALWKGAQDIEFALDIAP